MDVDPRDARLLAGEVERLFDIELCCSRDRDGGLEEIVARFEQMVRADARHAQLGDLIAALASDRSSPFRSVVDDLAEILLLPRARRSEYAGQPASPGPWVFPKLMLEYAVWAGRIEEVVGSVVSPFCAGRCPEPPVGCCSQLGYDMGLVPDGMLRVQELEATRHGWRLPAAPDRDKCRYHTRRGCALRRFKTPACLQYLCPPLRAELERAHNREAARTLIDALQALGCCDIDRHVVFDRMAVVVRAGEALAK